VFWSESSALCAIASDTSIFVLQHDQAAVSKYLQEGGNQDEGCEEAFQSMYEVQERVSTGRWIGGMLETQHTLSASLVCKQ
jgi:coatomer subunit beta'